MVYAGEMAVRVWVVIMLLDLGRKWTSVRSVVVTTRPVRDVMVFLGTLRSNWICVGIAEVLDFLRATHLQCRNIIAISRTTGFIM